MTYEEYAAIEAMNWSSLKHLHENPLAYQWWVKHERPDSPAMALGRAIHVATLEPAVFAATYYTLPARPENAKGNAKKDSDEREAYDDWKHECAVAKLKGGEELSAADDEKIGHMTHAIRNHAAASAIIKGSRHEETVTWTDEETGVACKGRLDILDQRLVVVADLKSTSKVLKPRIVATEFAQRLYHGQLAFYHDGAIAAGLLPSGAGRPAPQGELDAFEFGDRCATTRYAQTPIIVAAQSVAPYDVAVFELDGFAFDAGRALYRRLLRRFVECTEADWWPGAASAPVRLELPPWAPGMAEAMGDDDDPDMDWFTKGRK